MSTFQLVASALAERAQIDSSEITPETDLAELGIDSLDTVELLMELEDRLGVQIEATKTRTVGDLTKAIDEASA